MKSIMLALFLPISVSAQVSPLPESSRSSIGYASVAEDLQALRSKPNVETSRQRDWTIIQDPATLTLWSFAPKGHAAHPAVVKRQVVQDGAAVSIKTDVLCEAEKAPCDALVSEFMRMNQGAHP